MQVVKYLVNTSNYVRGSSAFEELQKEEMNKFTLFLVFSSGILFSILVSLLKSSFDFPSDVSIFGTVREVNFELLDDGFLLMAQLGSSYDENNPNVKHNSPHKRSSSTELEERSSEVEALNSVRAAVELVAAGKNARAGRLLEHAHSLAPRLPDVLLTYGEYLEQHKNDIVRADQMFLKALTVSPSNSRALRNRRRTLPLVERLDSEVFERIDDKRDELSLIPPGSGALRRIKKEAYFLHIYHTAGIEGNTLTLEQTRMILETGLSVGGKSIMEHNEILGLDLALRYINTTLVHRIGKISLQDILEIHRRILGHVDPVEGGRLRTTQVFVSEHVPPAPCHLHPLMEEFVTWLNSDYAQQLHPIKYAALAHYKLVYIHPFVDGNGRTARLLMNFLLMQAGYPPIIVRKQDRHIYYNRLQLANDGDTRPFIRFISHCTEKTVDVYLWATKDHLPELDQDVRSKIEKDKNIQVGNKIYSDQANYGLISKVHTSIRNYFNWNLLTKTEMVRKRPNYIDVDVRSTSSETGSKLYLLPNDEGTEHDSWINGRVINNNFESAKDSSSVNGNNEDINDNFDGILTDSGKLTVDGNWIFGKDEVNSDKISRVIAEDEILESMQDIENIKLRRGFGDRKLADENNAQQFHMDES